MSSSWQKNIEYVIGPYLVPLIIYSIYSVMRVKKINENLIRQLKRDNRSIVFAFWHGRQFLLNTTHRFRNIHIMTSLSRDGDLQTAILSRFGYSLIRGSSGKRGAAQATLQMIKKLEQGYDAAFAADGPGGPGFVVKPGLLYIAQKTNSVVVPASTSTRYKKIFNNWDRYLLPIPIPFNKGVVIYGKPIEVKENDNLETKSKELEIELNRLDSSADNLCS